MKRKTITRLISLLALLALLGGTSMAAMAARQGTNAQATSAFTFTPAADAYVLQSKPSTNYGRSTALRADSSPVTRSYLRFTVSGLNGGAIQSAKLRVYSNSSNSTGYSVRGVADNSWVETSIVYSNAPTTGSIIGSSSSCSSGAWVDVDVSSYVTAAGTYSFALTTTSGTSIKLSSRETGSKAPQLVVTTATTATATATGAATQIPTMPSLPSATPAPSLVPTATSMPAPTATAQADWQPVFPIRAAFYYPWFPEAWTQSGIYPYTNYTPTLGYYSNLDQTLLRRHLDMLQYAKIQAGIASWWGQGSQTDNKIAGLLQAAAGTNFRWSLYYENESMGDPSASQIQSDLTYIRDRYGRDPSFLRVGGKFVVFVYAAGNDACGMVDRWKQGNTVGAYVVLKVFSGYRNCTNQPNSWHQYSPAVAADRQDNLSYAISPGFWLKGQTVRLARDLTRWNQNVRDMVASGTNWELVTTFSEWGEGTAVEPATQWASASGYGQYLDALHYDGNTP